MPIVRLDRRHITFDRATAIFIQLHNAMQNYRRESTPSQAKSESAVGCCLLPLKSTMIDSLQYRNHTYRYQDK